jgi:uncharacterized membrane protein
MRNRLGNLKLLVLVIMSLIGLAASVFVLIIWYELKTAPPACTGFSIFGITVNSIFGIPLDCGAVLGSQYSTVFGVPLEFLAVAYFIVNLTLVYLIAFGSDGIARRSLRVLFGWRFIGLVLVPYLIFIEVVLIKAICVYCTTMHVAIVVDFIIISYLLFYKHMDLGLGSGSPPTPSDEPVVQ